MGNGRLKRLADGTYRTTPAAEPRVSLAPADAIPVASRELLRMSRDTVQRVILDLYVRGKDTVLEDADLQRLALALRVLSAIDGKQPEQDDGAYGGTENE